MISININLYEYNPYSYTLYKYLNSFECIGITNSIYKLHFKMLCAKVQMSSVVIKSFIVICVSSRFASQNEDECVSVYRNRI